MQIDNPLISVIVPVYNVEQYLQCCIQSILDQTFHQIEIILVDDGSTDCSGKICDYFAKQDKRVRVIHQENGGTVLARNEGIKAAQGEYVSYVDSDDWIDADMLELMYSIIQEQNVDIVMCGYYEETGNKRKAVYHGVEAGKYDKDALRENVYPKMIVNESFFEWGIIPGFVAKLLKKKCIESFQFEEDIRIKMGDDAACIFPCLLSVQSIYIMHKCLYHYRQLLSSMVRTISDSDKERELYRIMYQYTKNKLTSLRNIYDCTEQWDNYVLFLMFQRADTLYRGFRDLDFLFPFSDVKRGETIILYGAGTYGQRLYNYIKKTNFCTITGWVDQNYRELRKLGLKVDSPDIIQKTGYEHIVIAITYAGARQGAYKDLAAKYGERKLAKINVDLIMSENSKKAFGLNEE